MRKTENLGLFMTEAELQKLIDNGEIIYTADLFHGRYAYKRDEILSKDKMVFEMHYTMVDDIKEICPEVISIYILPSNINKCIKNLKDRHMDKKLEKERVNELKEQYNKFLFDKDLQKKFDYIFNNNFDRQSVENMIHLVKDICKSRGIEVNG